MSHVPKPKRPPPGAIPLPIVAAVPEEIPPPPPDFEEPPPPPPFEEPEEENDSDSDEEYPIETSRSLRSSSQGLSPEEEAALIEEELAALEREEEAIREQEQMIEEWTSPVTSINEEASQEKSEDQSEILSDFKSLINDPEYSDFSLVIGGNERIACHKAILNTRSQYFNKLFVSNKAVKELVIKDIQPSVIKILVEYVYCGRAEVQKEKAQEIFNAANTWQLKSLADRCSKMLGGVVNSQEAQQARVDNDPNDTAKNREFRMKLATEMTETEKTYVKSLQLIFDEIQKPLRMSGELKNPILPKENTTAIFSHWEVILKCHNTLLKALEDRMNTFNTSQILGDIFLEKTAFIKLYKHYVNNFDKAIVTLKQSREKYPLFRDFLAQMEYKPILNSLGLESFLILPVQRIPRYVMLLQELLKYTPTSHKDRSNLEKALENMAELANYINSHKNTADNITKILQIQDRIVNMPPSSEGLVKPRRSILREGTLLSAKKKKLTVFLFNDALLFTKPKGKSKLKFKGLINLTTSSLNRETDKGDFEIICPLGKFVFNCIPEEKESWIKAMADAIEGSQKELLTSAFSGTEKAESDGSKQFKELWAEENLRKRSMLAVNMATSEAEYNKHLTDIAHIFYQPLKSAAASAYPILALEDVEAIFPEIENMWKSHTSFLESIKTRVDAWNNEKSTLGDLYLYHVINSMKMYMQYIERHPDAIERLEYFQGTNQSFTVFLIQKEKDCKQSLKELLDKPLKLFSAYYLQLQELLQYTHEKHPDYEHLKIVVARLRENTQGLLQRKASTVMSKRTMTTMNLKKSTGKLGPLSPELKRTTSMSVNRGSFSAPSPITQKK